MVPQFTSRVAVWAERRRQWRTFYTPSALHPRDTLVPGGGADGEFYTGANVDEEGDGPDLEFVATHHGRGCSAGRSGATQGPVRVVSSLAQASTVRRGDVLVTRDTGPAWTPLFSVISALVMEEGGMLSHGAVVARECGIPAVSYVRGATRVLKTGQRVHVDGLEGFVGVMRV